MRLTLLILIAGITGIASPFLFADFNPGIPISQPRQRFNEIFEGKTLVSQPNTKFAEATHNLAVNCPEMSCPPDLFEQYMSTEISLQKGRAFIDNYQKAVKDFQADKEKILTDIKSTACNKNVDCTEAANAAREYIRDLDSSLQQNVDYLKDQLVQYRGNFTNNKDWIQASGKVPSASSPSAEKLTAALAKMDQTDDDTIKKAFGRINDALYSAGDKFKNIESDISQEDIDRTAKALQFSSIPACKEDQDSKKCKQAAQAIWTENAIKATPMMHNVVAKDNCAFMEKVMPLVSPFKSLVGSIAGTIGYFYAEKNGYGNRTSMFLGLLGGQNTELGRRYEMIMQGRNPDGMDLGALQMSPAFGGGMGTPGGNMTLGAGKQVGPALSPYPNANGQSAFGQANSAAAAQTALLYGYNNNNSALNNSANSMPSSLTTAANLSASGAGSGSTNKISTGTAVSTNNYYNSEYSKMTDQAKTFNSQYSSTANTYKTYNGNMTDLASGYNPSIPSAYASSAKQAVATVKGAGSSTTTSTTVGSSTSSRAKSTGDEVDTLLSEGVSAPSSGTTVAGVSTSTTDIRLNLSKIQEQRKELLAMATSRETEIMDASTDFYWGSREERKAAFHRITLAQTELTLLKSMIAANEGYNYMYRSIVTPFLLSVNEFSVDSILDSIFELGVLYADNGKKHGGSRTLNIAKVKTTNKIGYRYREGWQEKMLDYADSMIAKAKETKKKLIEVRKKMQVELKKDLPKINPKRLPNFDGMIIQLTYMNNLREASIKNMKLIDSALEYQRKKTRNKELIKKYEQEAGSLKTSMNELVDTINVAYGEMQKSYDIVDTLNLEIPKAEGLRQAAKEMVEKGL